MRRKIFLNIWLSSLLTMILSVAFVTTVYYADSRQKLSSQIIQAANAVKAGIEALESSGVEDYAAYLAKAGAGENRLTLISADGFVLYDNYGKADSMENHLERPEIVQALQNGTGSDSRFSETLGEDTYYYAIALSDGNILRLSCSYKSVLGLFGSAFIWSLIILIFVLVIVLAEASYATKRIIEPINRLNLDDPKSNNTYEELAPLLTRMEKQNARISRQIQSLSEQQSELDYITGNMTEGFVIFGEKGAVLFQNNASKRIFGNEAARYYLELCREADYISGVENALKGDSSQVKLTVAEKTYELAITSVKGSLKGYAAVMFAADITQRENSEKLRREFSANVSHELKTPLTSIMGYAEIIGNGIADPADIPEFSRRIHAESSRLLTLIEDIINLSRLDESQIGQQFEPVELDLVCREVVAELKKKAEKMQVTVAYTGESCMISGVRHVLHEMVFNLCDNAIAYNVKGGRVSLTLSDNSLTVSDTGIGIPPEEQERVFERFYRVDKSHSKQTGGTGLGLSIVKHGAKLHNASVTMISAVGEGTSVKLTFESV